MMGAIMNNEISCTGTSWSNPIWYKNYRIYVAFSGPYDWAFCHNDYDGAIDSKDNRCGHGINIQDCQLQINELENNK